MRNLVSIQRFITPDDDPIERKSLVGAAGRVSVPIGTKPGVVDLRSDKASLFKWVGDFTKVEELFLFVGTKEKDVDFIGLGKFRVARVPCREVSKSDDGRVKNRTYKQKRRIGAETYECLRWGNTNRHRCRS